MNIANEYDQTSGPANPSVVKDLPPVDIQGLTTFNSETGITRAAGFVVIRARWNFRQLINFGGMTTHNIVMASISELFPNPAEAGQITLPDIGAAHMYVRAVAPQSNKVIVSGYIDWERSDRQDQPARRLS